MFFSKNKLGKIVSVIILIFPFFYFTKEAYEYRKGSFGTNKFNSNIDQELGPDFRINVNALLLPFSRGYGNLHSWQVAMTLDSDLLEMGQRLANLSPDKFYQIDSLFEEFLFRWAGVENATLASVYEANRNGSIDASAENIDVRKVAFMERMTGLDFRVPNASSIAKAQDAWNLFYNTLLTRFLTQGTFSQIFPEAHYSFATDGITIGTSLDTTINNILSLSTNLDQSSFLNYAYYSKMILESNKNEFRDTEFDTKINTMLNTIVNSIVIEGFSFNGAFNIGSDGDDTLRGSNNSDIIKGLNGRDIIYAAEGNDYIEGGKGNDIYKFNFGDGRDVIEEFGGMVL